MWIDSHCHLASPKLTEEAQSRLIHEAGIRGVRFFMQAGVNPDDWRGQVALQKRFPDQIGLCFGLHPWWVAEKLEAEAELEAALQALHDQIDQAIALGELGLDYSKKISPRTFDQQKKIFRAQLKIALTENKPIVLHVVHAHADALAILREEGVPEARGIIHSFSESPELAKSYVELGLKLSMGPSVIRAASGKGFEKLKSTVLKMAPTDFVCETDAPDQVGELTGLLDVAAAIGAIRGESKEEILQRSNENFKSIWK